MNIALTQAIAVIQAKIAVLESKVHAFTDLADMQAFRTLKRKVNLFIESKSAGRETPIDPLSHVRSELFAVVKAMELTEQYFSNCMAYDLPKEGKIVLTKAGLSQEKQEYERKLSEIAAEFPQDCFERDGALVAPVEAVRNLIGIQLPNTHSVTELWLFTHGRGPLHRQVLSCWTAYESEFTKHEEFLENALDYARRGDHVAARHKLNQLKRRFACIDYQTAEQLVTALEQSAEHEKDAELLRKAAAYAQAGDHHTAQHTFDLTSKKFSDLNYEAVRQLILEDELKADRDNDARLLSQAKTLSLKGDYLSARTLFSQSSGKFSALDYDSVNQQIARWEQPLDAIEEQKTRIKTVLRTPVSILWWRPAKTYVTAIRKYRHLRSEIANLKALLLSLKADASMYPGSEYEKTTLSLSDSIDPLIESWESSVNSTFKSPTFHLASALVALIILILAGCAYWLQNRHGKIVVVSPYQWDLYIDGVLQRSISNMSDPIRAGTYNVVLQRQGAGYQTIAQLRPGKQVRITPVPLNVTLGTLDLRFVLSRGEAEKFYNGMKHVSLVQIGGQSTNSFSHEAACDYLIVSNLPPGPYDISLNLPPSFKAVLPPRVEIEEGKTLIMNVPVNSLY